MRKSLRLEVKCNEDAPAPSYLIQLVTEKTTTAPPELEKGNLSYPARKILRCGHWYCRLCTVAIVDASTLRFFIFIFLFADNIFYVNGHYVRYTMLVQRFEPQGRRLTNFHYYYHHHHHHHHYHDAENLNKDIINDVVSIKRTQLQRCRNSQ